MNLFLLSIEYLQAALAACDAHCVKMVLESTQLLYSAWHVNNNKLPKVKSGPNPYKLAHENHPTSIWVRECEANYMWLLNYAFALAKEYSHRYSVEGKEPKVHACVAHLQRLKKWGYPSKINYEKAEVQEEIVPLKKKRKRKEKKATVFATVDIPTGCTPFPLCFGEEGEKYMVKDEDGNFSGVLSYQKYYQSKKDSFKKRKMSYKRREKPKWLNL